MHSRASVYFLYAHIYIVNVHTGKEYRVCMVARDDNPACAGVAPSASSRGWYGETHCVLFEVLRPNLKWLPATERLFTGEVEALVGCKTSLTLSAGDFGNSSVTLEPTGNYDIRIYSEPSVPLPLGAVVTSQTNVTEGCRNRTATCEASRQFEWRPTRGTEGRRFSVCFGVRDEHEITSLGKSCAGGLNDGKGCHDHSECPGIPGEAPGTPAGPAGTCNIPSSCITLHVVRCRYCAEGTGLNLRTHLDIFIVRVHACKGVTSVSSHTRIHIFRQAHIFRQTRCVGMLTRYGHADTLPTHGG